VPPPRGIIAALEGGDGGWEFAVGWPPPPPHFLKIGTAYIGYVSFHYGSTQFMNMFLVQYFSNLTIHIVNIK